MDNPSPVELPEAGPVIDWVISLYRWRVNHDDVFTLIEVAVAFAVFLGLGIAIAPIITPALLTATDVVGDFLFYHLFCMD